MKPATANLDEKISDEVTNFVSCWKLTLKDGSVMGFTSNSTDLEIDGILYRARTGVNCSHIETSNNFSVDNLDVTGVLNGEDITEASLLTGKYDFAKVEIFSVDTINPANRIIERVGYLGEVTVRDGLFISEVRGLAQRLQCQVGELYSPTCRATFGDRRCKVDLAAYTMSGTVENVISRQVFVGSIDKPSGYFSYGEIKWTSGKNKDLRMEIKEYSNRQFVLTLSMPHPIEPGDTFSAIAGCDKAFSTCCKKFNNAINFRGEPTVPGSDVLFANPSTAHSTRRG